MENDQSKLLAELLESKDDLNPDIIHKDLYIPMLQVGEVYGQPDGETSARVTQVLVVGVVQPGTIINEEFLRKVEENQGNSGRKFRPESWDMVREAVVPVEHGASFIFYVDAPTEKMWLQCISAEVEIVKLGTGNFV